MSLKLEINIKPIARIEIPADLNDDSSGNTLSSCSLNKRTVEN